MDSVDSSRVLCYLQFKNVFFYKKIEMIHVTAFLRSMELLFNLKTEDFS